MAPWPEAEIEVATKSFNWPAGNKLAVAPSGGRSELDCVLSSEYRVRDMRHWVTRTNASDTLGSRRSSSSGGVGSVEGLAGRMVCVGSAAVWMLDGRLLGTSDPKARLIDCCA